MTDMGRLTRTITLLAVIAVAGGLVMRSCARRMERRITASTPTPAPIDTMSGPPDSARAVALAQRAYALDHGARGETAPPSEVTTFTADSAGFLVGLKPAAGASGARALARVGPDGQVELRRLGP